MLSYSSVQFEEISIDERIKSKDFLTELQKTCFAIKLNTIIIKPEMVELEIHENRVVIAQLKILILLHQPKI